MMKRMKLMIMEVRDFVIDLVFINRSLTLTKMRTILYDGQWTIIGYD